MSKKSHDQENSLSMTPGESANKPRQTANMPQIKEKQSQLQIKHDTNQRKAKSASFLFPSSAREEPFNTATS